MHKVSRKQALKSNKIKEYYLLQKLIVAFIIMLTGCVTTQKLETNPMALPTPPTIVKLAIGDEIEIKFRYWPELDDRQVIRPDGKISLQYVDEVQAAGLTPKELDSNLTSLYETKLKEPVITVIVRSLANQRIYVGGEVGNQGLITYSPGMTPLQAVIQSGGFTEDAKPESAIVIRKGIDNKPVPLRINLKEVIGGGDIDSTMNLQPEDIVYVPKSNIAQANKFVNQYIEKLLLFRGTNLSFSYELHDDRASD